MGLFVQQLAVMKSKNAVNVNFISGQIYDKCKKIRLMKMQKVNYFGEKTFLSLKVDPDSG